MPAPVKHGVQRYLRHHKLPPGCEHVTKEAARLERVLEETILTLRNSVTAYEAVVIQTARRQETIYRLLQHYMNHQEDELKLKPELRLAYLRDMKSAAEARDKAVEKLNINVDPKSLALDVVYGGGANE